MKRHNVTLLALLTLCATACFSMEHRLPAGSYFGTLPRQPGQAAQPAAQGGTQNAFTISGHKAYFLAGLFPYTTWGAADLVKWKQPQVRIEQLRIESEFDWLDNLLWLVPGQFYGYYFFAPRTIRVSGTQVRVQQ